MVNLAELKVGPLRYNAPTFQVCLLGFVVFCTVGMFQAISNLGAGGTQDISLSDTANAVLYGTFAVGGMFAGGVCNLLGPRLTLFIGSLGYALYVGALWCHQTQGTGWFLILAGAILGLCASMLWSAQGALMMSLPTEEEKGRAFSVFWAIFSMGSLVGGLIVLGLTIKDGAVASLSTGIYLAFIIIMFVGSAACWTILPADKVVRKDGTIVAVQRQASMKEELKGMIGVLKSWRLLALFPMFFASNYFYSYQGAMNSYAFDGRTRALVAVGQGAGAIVGAILIGLVVDKTPLKSRRHRGYVGVGVVFTIVMITWGCALAWQLTFTRATPKPNWDYKDGSRPVSIVVLLCFMYVGDAAFQGLVYWIMGTMSNDPWTLARYAGVYKAIQSAGAAGSFGMDAVATPYLNELLVSALLVIVSLPFGCWVIRSVPESMTEIEVPIQAEDIGYLEDEHVALPKGHEYGNEKDSNVLEKVVSV